MTQWLEEDTLLSTSWLRGLPPPWTRHAALTERGTARALPGHQTVIVLFSVPGECQARVQGWAPLASKGVMASGSGDSVAPGGTLAAAQEGTSISPPQFPLKIRNGVQIGRDTPGSGICIFGV